MESPRTQLEEKLRAVNERLRSEMLARGFDPAQDENVALTAPLAKLYVERENLRAELDTLSGSEDSNSLQGSTMTEIERIVDQLNRAIEGEAWHGPAVMEILKGISAPEAAVRRFESAHSIWELALHIEAWLRACRRRLEGDRAQLADAEDWPPLTNSDERAWEQTRRSIKEAAGDLASAISCLDDSQLDQPIIEGMSSVYVTLHGVIQHSLYHAGQIAILKKS